MFCSKCGTHLSESSKFCIKCGIPITAESTNQKEPPPLQFTQRHQPAHEASHESRTYHAEKKPVPRSAGKQAWSNDISYHEGYTHPYQTLGGWLKCFVYAPLIGMGLLAILEIFYFYMIFQLIPYIQYTGALPIILISVNLAGFGVVCFLIVKYSIMLKNRDPGFLRYYELAMIVSCAIYVVLIAVSGLSSVYNLIFGSIMIILASASGIVSATLYFRKSIRARIYMGNDDYLGYSIFSRNAEAPTPGEILQYASSLTRYASSQADSQRQPAAERAKRPKPYYYSAGNRYTR